MLVVVVVVVLRQYLTSKLLFIHFLCIQVSLYYLSCIIFYFARHSVLKSIHINSSVTNYKTYPFTNLLALTQVGKLSRIYEVLTRCFSCVHYGKQANIPHWSPAAG